MDLGGVGERAAGSTGVGGSWWGMTLDIDALQQEGKGGSGTRCARVDFAILGERRMTTAASGLLDFLMLASPLYKSNVSLEREGIFF
jgi:hypothetical protein